MVWPRLLQLARLAPLAVIVVGCGQETRPSFTGADAAAEADSAADKTGDALPDMSGDSGGMAASCLPPASTICVTPAPSFATEIVPILDARCNTCHDATLPEAPWPLHEHEDVLDWKTVFVTSLLDCTMPPPDSGAALPESERQRIFAWVACGLPDN